ncbi:MAG: DUF1330 domain-containing protein [Alphaproteobacteria bacterium]|nr:DUF1330 domain-containing protein [Alphaproteobacteria bacterium]
MAAYILAQLDIHDPEGFQRYREKVAPLVATFGGRYLVRGGEVTTLEGELAAARLVIIEFADRKAAERWYFSDEYQEILPLRLNSAKGSAVIVDGV